MKGHKIYNNTRKFPTFPTALVQGLIKEFIKLQVHYPLVLDRTMPKILQELLL